jgi:hypothetical protein
MANLDDLIVSITERSFEEALSIIKAIRLSRRTPKKVTKTRSTTPKTSKTKKSAEELVLNLTSEQRAKMLEDLLK